MARSLALRLLLVTFAASGCTGLVRPTATPGDLTAVEQALVLRGVTIVNAVGGDPGCADTELHDNAVRFDVRLAEGPVRSLYLFRWRRTEQFDAAAAAFENCALEVASRTPTELTTVEVRPWRAFGVGWDEPLRRTVDAALRGVGGG